MSRNAQFQSYTNLLGVRLPTTLKNMGINTFDGCSSLVTLNLPEGLTAVGTTSLKNTALTSVIIPASLGEICLKSCGE